MSSEDQARKDCRTMACCDAVPTQHSLQCTQCSLCLTCACLQDDQETIGSLRLEVKSLEGDKKELAFEKELLEEELLGYLTSLRKAKVMQCSQSQAT